MPLTFPNADIAEQWATRHVDWLGRCELRLKRAAGVAYTRRHLVDKGQAQLIGYTPRHKALFRLVLNPPQDLIEDAKALGATWTPRQ